MTPDNEAILIQEIRSDEGVRYTPYLDSRGIPTTGVGHNLNASPIPSGWSYPLTDDQVNHLLDSDLLNVYHDLDRNLPWWEQLCDVRQRVVANMCFQMGINGLIGFRKALISMRQGDYPTASQQMLASDWATQTPNRAKRLARMMLEGANYVEGESM